MTEESGVDFSSKPLLPVWFVAGWRPVSGWVCVAAIAWAYLVEPAATWALAAAGSQATIRPASAGPNTLELVIALLGMGGLRSFDKANNIAR